MRPRSQRSRVMAVFAGLTAGVASLGGVWLVSHAHLLGLGASLDATSGASPLGGLSAALLAVVAGAAAFGALAVAFVVARVDPVPPPGGRRPERGRARSVRTAALPPAGRERPAEGRVRQRLVGRVAVLGREVATRRQAEEALEAKAEALEATNRQLEAFAQVVAHELKAPLRAVAALSQMLAGPDARPGDEACPELAALLVGRVRRLELLIDAILQYARAGTANDDQDAECDLDEVVDSVVAALAPPAHVRVTCEDPLPRLRCGFTEMQLVMQNLISNALKFLDKPEGEIWIGCERRDDTLVISVADNGPGIAPCDLYRIFGMFETLRNRDEFESTGVGLAIVKKVINAHGGLVWVTSTPGLGSTFFFSLPEAGPEVFSLPQGGPDDCP